jgi:hypothetical protein
VGILLLKQLMTYGRQISLDSMTRKNTEKFMPILYNAMGEYNILTLKEIW